MTIFAWKLLEQYGRIPCPRSEHAAILYKNSVYVFGGGSGAEFSTLYEFNTIFKEWSIFECKGEIPEMKFAFSSIQYNQQMIIFGGHTGTKITESMYSFDFTNNTWNKMIQKGKLPQA